MKKFYIEGELDKQCAICSATEGLGFDLNPETDKVAGTVCRDCKLDIQMAEHVLGLPTFGAIAEYLKMTRS